MTSPDTTTSLIAAASTLLTYADKFFNSAFALSFIGALAGAGAGALTAQHVIEKTRARDEMLREIRATNAAIMVAFTICNTALGLKKQLVAPMYDKFQASRIKFLNFLEQRRTGQRQGNAPFVVEADFQRFMAPILPSEALRSLVFDRVNVHGKPLSLVSQVENAGVGLSRAIAERDQLIGNFKTIQSDDASWPFSYFGIEQPSGGSTHREYADIVEVIHSYTNDLIYFSAQLCTYLENHGQVKSEQFNAKFRKEAPVISKPDFSGPRESGLFPADEDYSSWKNWVVEKTTSTKQGA